VLAASLASAPSVAQDGGIGDGVIADFAKALRIAPKSEQHRAKLRDLRTPR
jgi:hypothetical protein